MHGDHQDPQRSDSPRPGARAAGIPRRDLLKLPVALGVAALALPALAAPPVAAASDTVTLAPRYFPLERANADIILRGKLAVITGASRGNGRAIGEALAARGVDVIGTSRNPATVPNPPKFPLLKLDITDPASVLGFVGALQAHKRFQQQGRVDILVNNAGRAVIGRIVPLSASDLSFYLAQRDLGMRTLYSGHVMVTNALLALLPKAGYGRIVFTVSVASYTTGAAVPGFSYIDAYTAAKAALRVYANNLDVVLRAGGSAIRVSTANPYAMHTTLGEHPNPIYTQPVNSSGLSDTDPTFNAVATQLRQLLAQGIPTSLIGEAYVQLLSMADPVQNVVVASPREPLATQGGNSIINAQILAENELSAVPLRCE